MTNPAYPRNRSAPLFPHATHGPRQPSEAIRVIDAAAAVCLTPARCNSIWTGRRRRWAMKAMLSKRAGGPGTLELEELPDPTPAAGEVLIAVKACGVNYPDSLIIEDRYQFKPQRPFAPGGEVAGVVEAVGAVGAGVTAFKPGDRV